MTKIVKGRGMPSLATHYRWLADNEDYRRLIALARDDQADTLADEMLEISDDKRGDITVDADGKVSENFENVQRSKLRIETRKWIASKYKPKRFGEKVQVGAAEDLPPLAMSRQDLARRIAYVFAAAENEMREMPQAAKVLLLPAPKLLPALVPSPDDLD
jgi:hypothetical protein